MTSARYRKVPGFFHARPVLGLNFTNLFLPAANDNFTAMRINLATPFAEKEAAKALGARWDATRKVWYVVDVEDLTPFLRWIPGAAKDAEKILSSSKPLSRPAQVPSSSPKELTADSLPASKVVHCGCDALPWEDCIHTRRGE